VIGVSGAVASGKTTVAEMLAGLVGGPIVSADAIAHQVLASDDEVKRAVIARWGNACLGADGGISRAKLAEIVFNSPADLAELNRIIHPVILRRMRELIDEARSEGAPWIVVDAALLHETGLDAICDTTLFVLSDWNVRAERARRDRGWGEDELRRRDAAQLPAERKAELSDYTVNNNGSPNETKRQIENIVKHIQRHRRKFNGQPEDP